MMEQQMVEVAPGTRIALPDGQHLEVTDLCAVGEGGCLYYTATWLRSRDESRKAWETRPLWRKALRLAPKGYWDTHQRVSPFGFLNGLMPF